MYTFYGIIIFSLHQFYIWIRRKNNPSFVPGIHERLWFIGLLCGLVVAQINISRSMDIYTTNISLAVADVIGSFGSVFLRIAVFTGLNRAPKKIGPLSKVFIISASVWTLILVADYYAERDLHPNRQWNFNY
jgi:hypothetical protein